MATEEQIVEIIIPENTLKSKRYFGFRRRNVIEGAILVLIIAFIIYQIPFVGRIKIILISIIGFSVFILSCIGIRDKSISEIFSDIRYNLQLPKIWHLRSINYANKRKKFKVSQETVYTNQSIAEKSIAYIKEKLK